MINSYKVSVQHLKGRVYVEDLGVDGRMLLN